MASEPCVVLTRSPADNGELAAALTAQGVPVCELPCLQTGWISPPVLPAGPDVLVFTSRRGVEGLGRLDGFEELLAPADAPAPQRAVVGPSTAAALAALGYPAHTSAVPATGAALARELNANLKHSSRIAIVRGTMRAGGLDETLRTAGHRVEELVVYRNLPTDLPVHSPFPISAIFVSAPSGARRLLAAMPWMRHSPFLVLGPSTAATLEELGATTIHRARPIPNTWAPSLIALHRSAPPTLTELAPPPFITPTTPPAFPPADQTPN
ncbi:MAG: uroporphyrinogen-III synthase [Planctomycetota bacterium]|jgi:uroporphyrinogen-III synthase|nr:hypothetical protein [Planctomycetota bacterium]MDP6519818.1 uroporphyrinogen-III synthase [Planctomycetota bacterium]MDP6839210.1 uroporphyrinogen-III synthase [Planctomycetota bacterium]MDP6954449.1 uroporphyrinogen-III synthase [Planctomycetota bacterium]